MSNLCPQCGAPIEKNVSNCEYCGAVIAQPAQQTTQYQQTSQYQQAPQTQQTFIDPERASWPVKNKIVAAVLAIVLGGLGVHKFYLGDTKKGVLFLLFFWTYIPAIIGFVEGIMILCSKDEDFQNKYKCRLG